MDIYNYNRNFSSYDFSTVDLKDNDIFSENNLLQELFNNFFDSIFILDNDYFRSIINCNKSAVSTFGFSKEELVGKSIGMLHVNEDSFKTFQKLLYSETQKSGFLHLENFVVKRKDGSVFVSCHSVMPLYDKIKKIKGWISIVRDVSEQVNTEARYIESNRSLENLAASIQNKTEKEKEKITKKYLESFGQNLTGLFFKITMLEKVISEDIRNSNDNKKILFLKEIKETVKNLIYEGRNVSEGIRPAIIDDLGISDAVIWLSEKFYKETGIVCNTEEIQESLTVPKDISILIFRICQEIFSNIKKHSKADMVNITLKKQEDLLILNIKDNGIGIDEKIIIDKLSLGILRIKVLVKYLGGNMKIIGNQKESYTSFNINIPF